MHDVAVGELDTRGGQDGGRDGVGGGDNAVRDHLGELTSDLAGVLGRAKPVPRVLQYAKTLDGYLVPGVDAYLIDGGVAPEVTHDGDADDLVVGQIKDRGHVARDTNLNTGLSQHRAHGVFKGVTLARVLSRIVGQLEGSDDLTQLDVLTNEFQNRVYEDVEVLEVGQAALKLSLG